MLGFYIPFLYLWSTEALLRHFLTGSTGCRQTCKENQTLSTILISKHEKKSICNYCCLHYHCGMHE